METKFLSDGRKVAIIGSLNQQETIVQEIFITNSGDEIPSGERFITKSLHDEPVKTYLEKQKDRHEKELSLVKEQVATYKAKLEREKNKLSALNAQMKSANRLSGKLDSYDWDLFCDVATGNIKYIVASEYYWYKPQNVDLGDYHYDKGYDGKRFDGLRMISVVFHGEHDHSYNMFNYRDGSGSASKIEVFRTKDELCDWLSFKTIEANEKGRLTMDHLVSLEEYIDVSDFREQLKEKTINEINLAYEKSVSQADKYREKRLNDAGIK